MADTAQSASGGFATEGEAVLFGFPSTPVEVSLKPRSRAWRMAGAARTMGIAVVVAPVVAIVPPHAPWVIGALAGGGILARRRWTEHFTVLGGSGACPKCGEPLKIKSGRLRHPHPLPCEACHHESTLQLPEEALNRMAPAD